MGSFLRLVVAALGWQAIQAFFRHRRVRDLGVCGLYLVAAYLVFSPSYANLDFFWDDEAFIFSNPSVINAPSWFSFWEYGGKFSKAWPLSYSVYWMMINYFPDSGMIFYKSVNIFLHALNGFVLFVIFRRIRLPRPFFLAMIFLAHPLQVEVVSWVMQFQTIIAGFFALLSMYCFLLFGKRRSIWPYTFAYLFFFLSLQAKSIAVALPVFFCYIIWYCRRPLRYYLVLVPFLLMSTQAALRSVRGTSLMLERLNYELIETGQLSRPGDRRLAANRDHGSDLNSITPWRDEHFFNFNNYLWESRRPERSISFKRSKVLQKAIVHYPTKIVLPVGLAFIYSQAPEHPLLVGAMCFLLFGLPVVLYVLNRRRIVFAVPVLLVATLLPVCGLSYIGFFSWSYVADRYAYLAVIALPLLLGIWARKSHDFAYAVKVYLVLVLCLSYWYGYKFNNPLRLYAEALNNRSDAAMYSLYFEEHLSQNLIPEAEDVLNEAVRKFPEDPKFKADRVRLEIYKKYLKGSN